MRDYRPSFQQYEPPLFVQVLAAVCVLFVFYVFIIGMLSL